MDGEYGIGEVEKWNSVSWILGAIFRTVMI